MYWETNGDIIVREPEAEPLLQEIENGTLYRHVRDIFYEGVGGLGYYRNLLVEYAGRKYIAKEFQPILLDAKEIIIFLIE
ncbi:MAG: hypothetical protein QXJ59_07130 [Thermofilaceae archaeon]